MKTYIFIIVVALSVIGFYIIENSQKGVPSSEVQKLEEIYGAYPSSYKSTVEDYLDRVLRDPDSKRVKWLREPQRDWHKTKDGITPGYLVCAAVNAKNGFGGYTGSKTAWFIINNGTVVQADMSASSCSP